MNNVNEIEMYGIKLPIIKGGLIPVTGDVGATIVKVVYEVAAHLLRENKNVLFIAKETSFQIYERLFDYGGIDYENYKGNGKLEIIRGYSLDILTSLQKKYKQEGNLAPDAVIVATDMSIFLDENSIENFLDSLIKFKEKCAVFVNVGSGCSNITTAANSILRVVSSGGIISCRLYDDNTFVETSGTVINENIQFDGNFGSVAESVLTAVTSVESGLESMQLFDMPVNKIDHGIKVERVGPSFSKVHLGNALELSVIKHIDGFFMEVNRVAIPEVEFVADEFGKLEENEERRFGFKFTTSPLKGHYFVFDEGARYDWDRNKDNLVQEGRLYTIKFDSFELVIDDSRVRELVVIVN